MHDDDTQPQPVTLAAELAIELARQGAGAILASISMLTAAFPVQLAQLHILDDLRLAEQVLRRTLD